MRIKQSLDVAQEVMENLFCNLNNVEIFIDNLCCFLSTFTNHIQN